ncbi:MAG: sulfite exporter TauE/SafE family protein [Deltaproteobacteria bacterium]|nr:sulfite exporter TauE/SafE family protein [Deltaproteobacteria bacterium]
MSSEKRMGWEVARELEQTKPSTWERFKPEKGAVKAASWGVVAFLAIFLVGCWLAGNPFEATQRIASPVVKALGWEGTDNWKIFWGVVLLAVVFEFLDASAGMGYGTALTPLLLVLGFNPKQIVPVVMIQQATAGMVGTFLHKEFANVEWRFKPMTETVRLWLFIAVTGCIAVGISVTAVYKIFKVAKIWISVYVAVLLILMGIMSLVSASRERPYRPNWMIFWGGLAAFNKGIGGGGYGPVVTIGGILSGIPVKTQMAITALSEGSICVFSILIWLLLLASGEVIDFLLLPSMMLGSMFAATIAPWMTRTFPERIWRWIVPTYSLLLAAYVTYKILPDVLNKLAG